MWFVLFALFASNFAADVTSWGMNEYNTRYVDSQIDSMNAHTLTLVSATQLCGPQLSSPLILGDHVIIGDLGGCLTWMYKSNGSIFDQKNMTSDYGLPPKSLVRATPTYSEGRIVLAVFGVFGFLPISNGVYIMAINATTRQMLWKTQLSTFYRALLTGAPTIKEGIIIQPLSSNEEAQTALTPSYQCCQFAGRIFGVSLYDGHVIWNTTMIPDELVGVGKYSGAAIWSSGVSIDGDYLYTSTGNLYEAPDAAQLCFSADPTNKTCFDPRVLYDSIVKLKWRTGEYVAHFRVDENDVWNAFCLINNQQFPCPLNPGPDADFGNAPMFTKSGSKSYVMAGQKSGFFWILDENLSLRESVLAGSSGVAGGMQFGSTINDDNEIFGTNTGVASKNFTFEDGQIINYGFWFRLTLKGKIKWQTKSPTADSIQGSVTSTNDVVFGATGSGRLCILDANDGEILWYFNTGISTIAAPAVDGCYLYWGTGRSETFSPISTPTRTNFYIFKLSNCN